MNMDAIEVAHPVEEEAQGFDRRLRNVRLPGSEVDRRHHVLELDGLEGVLEHFALTQLVAFLAFNALRVLRPRRKGSITRELSLNRGARIDSRHRVERRSENVPRLSAQTLLCLLGCGISQPPENVTFDAKRFVLPTRFDEFADRGKSTIHEASVFHVGDIRQAQDRWTGFHLLDQSINARLPLIAHQGRSGSEDSIDEVEAHHAINRGAKVHLERLTACCPCEIHASRRKAIARRQGPLVELQHEVTAASLSRHDSAGNVIAAVCIGCRSKSPGCHEPDAGKTGFTLILCTVAIAIVEHLTHHIGTREVGVRDHAHRGACFPRQWDAGRRGQRLRAVRELAFGYARTDGQQKRNRTSPRGFNREPTPCQDAPFDRRLRWRSIDLRGPFEVTEASGVAILDAEVRKRRGESIDQGDLVRDKFADAHVHEWCGFGQPHCRVDRRIKRHVVVEDLRRTWSRTFVKREKGVIASGGRNPGHRSRWRQRRSLNFAVRDRRRDRVVCARGTVGYVERSRSRRRDRRNDLRFAHGKARRRRCHAQNIVGRPRTHSRRTVEIELIEAFASRNLALLIRVIETRRWKRNSTFPLKHKTRASDRRAFNRAVHHAIRLNRQVQIQQVASAGYNKVCNLLWPVGVSRVRGTH